LVSTPAGITGTAQVCAFVLVGFMTSGRDVLVLRMGTRESARTGWQQLT
jgi:hypothetical protein